MPSHRSKLKQTNKPFKGTSINSKKKNGGGKTIGSTRPTPSKTNAISMFQSKQQRLNTMKTLRNQRREQTIAKRRSGATLAERIPPKVVMILPFKRNMNPTELKHALASYGIGLQNGKHYNSTEQDSDVTMKEHHNEIKSMTCQPVTFQLPSWAQMTSTGEGKKQKITLIDVSPHLYPKPMQPTTSILNHKKKKNDATEFQTEYVSKEGLQTVLDVAKIANVILCLLPGTCSLKDPPFDEFGYELLSALKLQGLPTPIGVMVRDTDYDALDTYKQRDRRKLVQRYFTSEFGDDTKFICLDDENSIKSVLRAISNVVPKEFSWRALRGYVLPDTMMLQRDSDNRPKLILEGYARGVGLTVKHPVHITGIGDLILERITAIDDSSRFQNNKIEVKIAEKDRVLEELTPEVEEQLKNDWESLRPFDPLAGEQTWPTEEELNNAETELQQRQARNKTKKIAVPQGTSEYQKAWFDELNFDGADHEDEACYNTDSYNQDESSMNDIDDNDDHQQWDDGLSHLDITPNALECETTNIPNQSHDEMMEEKKRIRFELEERSREDLEFPDEVDTPCDKLARERFSRYRGLKSFKTSPWDPYEELPYEYSRIYEFDSFRPTVNFAKHRFMEDCLGVDNGISTTGLYVKLEIRLSEIDPVENLKLAAIQNHLASIESYQRGLSSFPKAPLVLSTLFPYERKVTVAHVRLTRQDGFYDAMPSKSLVEMQCGFRRFLARPIFSSGNNTLTSHVRQKSKFERFFHSGTSVLASMYCPVMAPPAHVLMFKSPEPSSQEVINERDSSTLHLQQSVKLCAWGSLLDADPRRVIVKRIMLTGYPFRVHRKKAVVRFMFFNPDDIRWFTPVELCSKRGLRGHIKEPLGTHGYMKCVFNDIVDQSDTICMYLYKRAYPKWFPPSWGGLETQTSRA